MIEARGLTKRYGTTTAVDDLSFRVESGRVTGFLGPNGAGKSTTMRMVLGLDRADAGGVRIDAKRMVSAGGRGIIQRHMRLANQHGTIVQEGTIGLMMWCRPSSAQTD